jgi:hypothetical protein
MCSMCVGVFVRCGVSCLCRTIAVMSIDGIEDEAAKIRKGASLIAVNVLTSSG